MVYGFGREAGLSLGAHVYQTGFWAISGAMAVAGAPLQLVSDGRSVRHWLGRYSRLARGWLGTCGVKTEYRGLDHLPGEPAVIAAKHQSWADGILHVARDRELAYVIGDHMLDFPLVGGFLDKAGAVVVDANSGGRRAPGAFESGLARLARERRDVLIFPEGGMSEPGTAKRYRSGVLKLAEALDRPVVPAATNLGCFWPKRDWTLSPGLAVVEYLPAIRPGDNRAGFMAQLRDTIESRTRALEAEAHASGRESG